MAVLAHMLGVNVALYNQNWQQYHLFSPGIIEPETYGEDYTRPYIVHSILQLGSLQRDIIPELSVCLMLYALV